MKIAELRAEFKKRIKFAETINSALIDYYREMWEAMENLYKYGYVTEYPNEFLATANGYVVNTQNYENFHIHQTLGQHDISATKGAARDFMAYWLGIR